MKNVQVEVKVNGKVVTGEDVIEVAKTDLEIMHDNKTLIQFFTPSGDKYGYPTYMSVKQAKKELQRPSKLGYTFAAYSKVKVMTTDIPLKEV